MKENIINLILQAENEYNNTVKIAVAQAEKYVDKCREEQDLYIDKLKNEWQLFEQRENEKLDKAFYAEEQQKKEETVRAKEQLKVCREKKADLISERLMKEVLSLDGYS